MNSSDEEVLLELCCLFANIRRKSKEKRKGRGFGKYLKKEQNKEFTLIYCRRQVSMKENRISGCLYNELFSKINEENWTAFQSMAWSLTVHKNTIRNCSIALQAFSSRSISSYTLYFLFHKGKDTSGIPQPSLQHLVYAFVIFFAFINALLAST